MVALHGDQVIVDLGASVRVGERPAEAHRAVDSGRVHRRQQLVGGDDRAPAAMTHVEPRIELPQDGPRASRMLAGRMWTWLSMIIRATAPGQRSRCRRT